MSRMVVFYFSDIVGFTKLSAKKNYTQSIYFASFKVVEFLNNLYNIYSTWFWHAANYDAYELKTIGDAYMVVSSWRDSNFKFIYFLFA